MKNSLGRFGRYSLFVLIMGCMLFSGCATTPLPLLNDGRLSYVMPYDANKRVIVFINKKGDNKENFYYCAEPSPDVIKDIKNNFNIEASDAAQKLGKITIANDFNTSSIQIGQRTQMIMFLRESLYRLCEFSINHDIDSNKAAELYDGVIKIAATVAKTNETDADNTGKQSEAKRVEAENVKKGLELLEKSDIKDENLIKGVKELLLK